MLCFACAWGGWFFGYVVRIEVCGGELGVVVVVVVCSICGWGVEGRCSEWMVLGHGEYVSVGEIAMRDNVNVICSTM